jgi:hypothetical protein
MASNRLRAIFLFFLSVLLLGLTSPSSALGQDLNEHETLSSDAESFRSLYATIAETERFGELGDAAELIASGEVSHSHSFWSEDAAIIETETTITLSRLVKGDAPAEIVVRSEGGFIPDDNIGMIAPHEASFAVGEQMVIFAHKQGDYYRIQNGAAGKLSLDGGLHGSAFSFVLDGWSDGDFTQRLVRASATASHYTATRRWKTPDTTVAFRINVNTLQKGVGNSADAFLDAIKSAAATWNQTPSADFTLDFAGTTQSTQTGYNHVNEIVFMAKGVDNRGALAQVWYTGDGTIVEADIWINDDFRWVVGDNLPGDEVDLQSALLHEFGHWLILNHSSDSTNVMYPTLAPGATKRQLSRWEVEGISAIYPCLQDACLFGH